jgi:hypothetical protein
MRIKNIINKTDHCFVSTFWVIEFYYAHNAQYIVSCGNRNNRQQFYFVYKAKYPESATLQNAIMFSVPQRIRFNELLTT